MPTIAQKIRLRHLPILAALVLATSLAACKKNEPPAPAPDVSAPAPAPAPAPPPAPAALSVSGVTLGNAIGPDKKVTKELDTFGKHDTIYASVATTGTSTGAKLEAHWTYEGKSGSKPVKDDSQTIAPTGDAVSEFDVSKANGWPAGDYKVEILLDGKSVATKTFKVS